MEHFLYTIEFIVQNLKVTKQNECAPAHYPYYAEFRFRRGLYVSIHQSDFGSISAQDKPVDNIYEIGIPSAPGSIYQTRNKRENGTSQGGKQGRGCAFVLNRDVDESDVIDIRVYKKTTDKCKFLIGAGDVPIKNQFKSVMDKFGAFNPIKYPQGFQTRIARQPDDKNQSNSPFDPIPYDKQTGIEEASIENRKTHTTPADEVPVFKWTPNKNDMGIVAEENPPQPDRPAAISFKVTVTLRSIKGEGSAFMTLLVRLTCMGRSLCKEIPYPSGADECKGEKDRKQESKDGDTAANARSFVRKSTDNSKSRCSFESVSRTNDCAPPNYPVTMEFRFRENIFISIPQSDFGSFLEVDPHNLKTEQMQMGQHQQKSNCIRSCAFTLLRPVDDSDVFDIRVYKKFSDKCKFFIGMADLRMDKYFAELMQKFHAVNSDQFYSRYLPPGLPKKSPGEGGHSISPLTPLEPDPPENGKGKGKQRPKRGATDAEVEERKTKTGTKDDQPSFGIHLHRDEFGIHTDKNPLRPDRPVMTTTKLQVQMKDANEVGTAMAVIIMRLGCMGKSICMEIPYPDVPCNPTPGGGGQTMRGNVPSDEEFHNEEYSLSVSSSFVDSAEDESIESIPVIRSKVDKTAYDEFEADLNGCGLAIRVLKNAHKVSAVRRYEDPSSCNQCKSGGDQKSAVSKLLQLVCRVLMSLNAEQGQSAPPCQPSNNTKAPTMQQICQCIQQMLGPPDAANRDCGRGSTRQPNRMQSLRRDKNKIDPCKNRSRGGCECNPQRDIMLFLESIRQVVANKKGLSDLANLLMQCTCGDGSDGDNKSGFASILKIILEKIKKCADDKPSMEKQMDLCSLVRTLTEIQNTRNSTRIRAGDNRSCSSESERNSLQTSENISCLVKKILELGVKYCSNRNINLRNVLCKILSDDVCNEELSNICRTIGQYLESDRNAVCDHVRKETAGRTVNAPCLPPVRGNIKYPSNMDYGTGSFSLPLPQDCDEGNVDQYRRKFKQRECCVQIDGPDIDNTMQGINQKLPTGIEICRKGTMDLDSDVFILKMGKKAETSGKKGLIEIELRTPKGPSGGRPQLATIATQVDEDMLKERVTSSGAAGEKAKGGGKGKGKGKGGKGKGKKGKK